MQAFVVYNGKTGAISHIHVEATAEGEPRRLEASELVETYVLERAEEELDPGELDVLEVRYQELEAVSTSEVDLYIDTEKRALAQRERPKA